MSYEYSDSYDWEELIDTLNNQVSKIADLEAKLAEMTEKYNACQEARKHEIEFSRQDKEELKQQLFESGLKTLEEIKLSEQRKKMLEDLSTKNWELEQQLAEKNKELKAKETLNQIFKDNREAKISFAVAELEKVKVLIHNAVNIDSPEYDLVGLYDAVSNQIKAIKGEE